VNTERRIFIHLRRKGKLLFLILIRKLSAPAVHTPPKDVMLKKREFRSLWPVTITFISATERMNAGHQAGRVRNYKILAYFPGVARVFIYPNLIVICVPSLADNFYAPWWYITHSSADLHTVTSSH
jgi:hypothetical protein